MQNNLSHCEVSIVVPVYNSEKIIRNCLDSIMAEDLTNCEVIVVDNASTDQTRERVKVYQERGVLVYTVGPPSRGLARKHGVENSKGKIIVMVDSDCIVQPGWLQEITKPIKLGKAKLVVGNTIGLTGQFWGKYAENSERSFFLQPNEFGQKYNFTSTQFAIDRECLSQVSFNAKFKSAEDFDFGIQCFLKNINVDYCESAMASHQYLNDYKGHMLKATSRGFWSYLVFRNYDIHGSDFKNKIKKNKGLENYRMGYTVVWAIYRLIRLFFVSKKTKGSIFYETTYALAWQCGVLYARFIKIFQLIFLRFFSFQKK